MIGYQHFMIVDNDAFPYTTQSIEENETPFIDDDSHTGKEYGMNWTQGPIRYDGSISCHTCIANLAGLKSWSLTNRDQSSYVYIDTGNQQGSLFRYGYNLKVDSITFSGTAEGPVDATINVYGWGLGADRKRTITASTTPPDMSGFNYNPIPWYLSEFVNETIGALTGFTWSTSQVTSWTVTINNNHLVLPTFDGYQVPYAQQAGILTVEGSFTLYDESGITPPSGSLDWFGAYLALSQSQSGGVYASPTRYITFPVCVPTMRADAGAARNEKKTLTINWTGRGTYTTSVAY